MPFTRLLLCLSLFTLCSGQVAAVAGDANAAASRDASAKEAKGPTFAVLEYAIEGNTVLPVTTVEEAVYPHMGEAMTIDDVEAARTDLEKAYRDAGYITATVDIPEQRVEEGVVVLKVSEGRLSRVRVVGARYFSQGRILAQAPDVREDTIPHFPTLQKQVGALNLNDRVVTPILRPGKYPGTSEFDLKVDDALPLHGNIDFDNRYSPGTTPYRLGASIRYDNLFQREHSIGFGFYVAPEEPSEARVWSINYSLPIGSNTLLFYVLNSDSDVGVAAGTTVLGSGRIYGLRYNIPLPSDDIYSHLLSLGIDHKRFDESLTPNSGASIKTPIEYTPLSLNYSSSLKREKSVTDFNTSLDLAVRGLGNDEQQFADKRFKAHANYLVWKAAVSHTHTLPEDFNFFGRFDLQLADQPLVNNEQYAAGGIENVRGYLEATAVGDNAFHGTMEMRTPSYAKHLGEPVSELRFHAFIDGARLRIRKPLPESEDRFTLASTGLGFRLAGRDGWNLRADVGYPLKEAGETEAGDWRFHFVSSYNF